MSAREDYPLLAKIGRHGTKHGVWGECGRVLDELDQLRACLQPPVDRDGNELSDEAPEQTVDGP